MTNQVYTAFCHIYGHDNLVCSIDNWGVARGTAAIAAAAPPATAAAATVESVHSQPNNGEVGGGAAAITSAVEDAAEGSCASKELERADWRWHLPLHWHVDPWRHHETHTRKGHEPTFMSLVALVKSDDETVRRPSGVRASNVCGCLSLDVLFPSACGSHSTNSVNHRRPAVCTCPCVRACVRACLLRCLRVDA